MIAGIQTISKETAFIVKQMLQGVNDMEQVMRNFFLFLSKNKPLTKVAKKYGLRFGAARFVAGESIDLAVEAIKGLNNQGLSVTIDYLGEFIDNEAEANEMA
ncbi:proline dehydrogenase, partial [Bacillus sp. SG-1]